MDYQLIIIGSGPGGYVAAIRAAQLGLKTAVVEEWSIGGTCLNRGCIPTKALLHASGLYQEMQREAAEVGIISNPPALDWEKMHAHKAEAVAKLRSGVETLLKANGVEILRGHGKALAAGTVEVTDSEGQSAVYHTENILLASGSEPDLLDIPGKDLPGVITSDDLLEGEVPRYQSIGIVGGGVIGCEIANFFQEIGTRVVIVEFLPRILGRMDKDHATTLASLFKRRGIQILLNSGASRVEKQADGTLRLFYETHKKDSVSEGFVDVEAVLIAKGRKPVTENLLGDGLCLEMNRRFVKVNEHFETSTPHIYAIGDLIGGLQLAHQAEAEGMAAVAYIAGKEPETDPNLVPAVVYTNPEMASIGLTEEEAEAEGRKVKIGKYLMAGNSKAIIDGMERGFVKIIADAETDKVLGMHIFSNRASDLISEWAAILANGLTAAELRKGMRPHPSYCEGISEALEALEGESIHTMPARKRS